MTPHQKARLDDAGLDGLDPATTPSRDATHFRRLVAAHQTCTGAERELHDAVKAAYAAGNSWAVIGAALEMSGYAAMRRFSRSV